jgi:Spy/CpxP family protein refolding chaperone
VARGATCARAFPNATPIQEQIMRRNALIAAIAAGLFSAATLAQMGGYGPGMGGMGRAAYGGGAYGTCMQGGAFEALGLTTDQRQQVAAIMEESAGQRLALMDGMQEQRSQALRSGNPDSAAMSALREQMFALAQERRTRIDAVLTPEQRERLHSGFGPGRGFFGPGR